MGFLGEQINPTAQLTWLHDPQRVQRVLRRATRAGEGLRLILRTCSRAWNDSHYGWTKKRGADHSSMPTASGLQFALCNFQFALCTLQFSLFHSSSSRQPSISLKLRHLQACQESAPAARRYASLVQSRLISHWIGL